ncbi:MAG: hypothetical protein A2Z72_07895 [Omnitrophica bacterium RBG_13_46_9]|nr:MAG: hypothetical protein A2Z72_07895 [Omnitrophica bacterium RBG_13_46_9]
MDNGKMRYISEDNFFALLGALRSDYEVYVPVKKGDKRFYKRFIPPTVQPIEGKKKDGEVLKPAQTDDIVIGEVRPVEPLKAFFYSAREVVAEGFKDYIPHSTDKPFAIVGVKACDLKGFKVQDYVFSGKGRSDSGEKDGDYRDPLYIKNREQNLIIASDCTCAINTCFCLALGIKPHPQEDFDINLSQIKGGFVVESGSPKGERLIKKHSSLFEEARQGYIAERERLRTGVIKEVEGNIKENHVPHQDLYKGIIAKNIESTIWPDKAKTCVECGACNVICPTCHCFLLYDQKDEKRMERLRIWDSCMIKDFARVAGGANPRPKLWMRLRNRFEKKFDFFPKAAGIYACTGCGRCISACPAKIDIRDVLKELVGNV